MKQPVPFAWISCVGEKGGAEALMIECLRELDRTRFEPHVIQLRPGPLQAMLEAIGVRVHVLRQHRMRELHRVAGAIADIRRLVRRHSLRFLHSNGFRAHVYGGLAARWSRIPEVWTTHTVEQPGLSTRLILAIPTARVLANCPRTAAYFQAAGCPTELVWPGVNRTQLERGTPRAELAVRYRLPADRRWLTMGARLQRYKGQREFLQAIASVPSEADVHGVIIGGSLFGQESDYERELRSLASQLGITDRITFTGFIPDADVAGLLAASYLTLHPAHEEDFGLAVAEAQALGVSTIAFAAVGPEAIIEEGQTGWLIPVGSQPELNRALAAALADPAEVRRRGILARARCDNLFSVARHVHQTQEIYGQVLAAASRDPN